MTRRALLLFVMNATAVFASPDYNSAGESRTLSRINADSLGNIIMPNLRYYYPLPPVKEKITIKVDLCIYGATPAGIAAAIQAQRMGKSVALLAFDKHLGGMTSSGLGATDIGNKAAVGGIAREFYKRLGKHYGKEESWTFEPSVAENALNAWCRENDIRCYYEQRLSKVRKDKTKITQIVTEGGHTFSADYFIDATYEGDLLARAGVSYTVGREANATYGETLNGVHFGHPGHNFKVLVDPFRIAGDPKSGLLPGISSKDPGKQGDGDKHVQAYNFRLCMTKAENRLPFPKPNGYDPERYELLARYIAARGGETDALNLTKTMPNGKTDTNNFGGFSSDNIGHSDDWAEADYPTRERIFQDHVTYQQGMMWFLSHDERLPESVRARVREWGLPSDEFAETGGWPHQLYVREGRRMVSDIVMTEHHCRRAETVTDSVGLAAYQMDSHNCQRIAQQENGVWTARNEGNVEVAPAAPYAISYRAIVPRKKECTNLLVPICLSASHIAYGSIRMEPVFFVLGQSAATAACLALDSGKIPVQDVNIETLHQRLRADKQIIEWDETTMPPTREMNEP